MRTACARRCRSSTCGRRPRRTWPRTSWTSGCSRPSTTSPRPRGPPRAPRRSSSCSTSPGCPRRWPRGAQAPRPDPRRPRRPPRDRPGTTRPGLAMSGHTTTTVRVIRTCGGHQATMTRMATKAEAARETGMHARRLQTLLHTRTEWTGVRQPRFCRDSTGLAATSEPTECHPANPHRCRSRPTSTRRAATA